MGRLPFVSCIIYNVHDNFCDNKSAAVSIEHGKIIISSTANAHLHIQTLTYEDSIIHLAQPFSQKIMLYTTSDSNFW
jgi:hypothetical protein